MSDTLPADAIERLTGYKRPADQLKELHRLGFWRARRAKVTGEVVLERPHYEAVKSGAAQLSPAPIVDVSDIRSRKPRNARPMDWDAPTALYRHFDKKGVLLYVGIAVDPQKRESAHRCHSEWREKIHRIEVEWLDSRHAAVQAERATIGAEHPKYNILHTRKA